MALAEQRAQAAPPRLTDDPILRRRQLRRAWGFLSIAFICSTLLWTAVAGGAYWYRGHATVTQVARVDVVQGDRAFIRNAHQRNWSAVPAAPTTGSEPARVQVTELREGDTLRTEEATRVLLTLWDGSTVEVFERTQLDIVELRATQYITRAKTVTLRATRGLIRVALAPGDYSRSRFQVLSGDAIVLMKEGEARTGGGSFLVDVTTGPDGESVAAVRASVRRGVGAVRVGDTEVRLDANEQTIVPAGGPPAPPSAARRDLVANGTFTADLAAPRQPFAPWLDTSTPGAAEGPFGRLVPVNDTIDGRTVSALELYRSADSTDPAVTGLKQALNVTVADFTSLELTADVKVLEQNLPGGGSAGSEYPLILRVNYRDASGAAKSQIWGFFILPDPATKNPPNGQFLTAGEWFPLRVDLRGLVPQPVRLGSIEVYASGHGYRARVTNVAIIGTE